MKTTHTWPWPSQCPPIPWDKKKQDEYDKQQREKIPSAPMVLGLI